MKRKRMTGILLAGMTGIAAVCAASSSVAGSLACAAESGVLPESDLYAERIDAKRTDIESTDAGRDDAKQTNPERIDAEPTEPVQTNPVRMESVRTDTERADTERTDAERVDAESTGTERVDGELSNTEFIDREPMDTETMDTDAGEMDPSEMNPIDMDAIDMDTTDMDLIDMDTEQIDTETEQTEFLEELQERIDELPDLGEYDYLPLEEKSEIDAEVDEIKEVYFEQLTDEEREQTDLTALLGLDLYTESYAYYQTEEEYEGQLTLEDMEVQYLSGGELGELQQEIDELPPLEEVTTAGPETEVCYRDDAGTLLTSEQADDLYLEVLDTASAYYALPAEQTIEVESDRVTALTAYFSVGITPYAAADRIGMITAYDSQRYNGAMTFRHPMYGYYEVETEQTGQNCVAFCTNSLASTPGPAGTKLYKEWEVTDRQILTILYYGYGGPGELVSHDRNGYFETHIAICYAMDRMSSNQDAAQKAYALLYQNVPDPEVWKKVKAWSACTGVSGTQDLVYAIFEEEPLNSLTIVKMGNGNPVAAAEFDLQNTDTGEWIAAVQTDEKGRACFNNLPAGKYRLTERKTAAGLQCLNEAVTIELPLRIRADAAEEGGADTEGAYLDQESGEWCIPNLTCTITNDPTMTLPQTGGGGFYRLILSVPFLYLAYLIFTHFQMRKPRF